ncbi:MAG: type I restriction enzyme HsdR N-terminal domain-containing protein [Cyclobacteriaceae bacterium]
MVKLNLPEYGASVRKNSGRLEIYDAIRRKYLVLTPEEWVRQHMVHYLHQHCGYPLSLMNVEGGLTYNKRQKRSDILVYDRAGQPSVLVECKSYKMKKMGDEVLFQAAAYNRELKATWIVITYGWGYYCWKVTKDDIIQEKEIPAWYRVNRQGPE